MFNTSDLASRDASSFAPGNADAAQDLYGTGVRVGIYLQAIGMSFSIIRLKSSGIKLTCAGLMLAIMGCWSHLVANQNISPAEALTIAIIGNALSMPALAAAACPTSLMGEGIGLIATYLATLLSGIAIMAFWAKFYRELPLLGTENKAFFFTAVKINGWFRVFGLVGCVFGVLGVLVCVVPLVWLLGAAFTEQKHGRDSRHLSASEKLWMARGARTLAVTSLSSLPMVIACVEMNIKYNHLEPTRDLTQPGQSIPLAIGIITLVDGFCALWSENKE